MIPPARWTSSMWTSLLAGATLLRHGTWRDSRSISAIVKSISASCAAASRCEHGVGRAAHRDIEAHRVLERFEAGDRARQDALVVFLVIALGERDDQPPGPLEQLLAVGVGGELRAVARQRKPQRLGQAVHRIGGEHARARSAGRAGRALDRRSLPRRSSTRSAAATIASTRSSATSLPLMHDLAGFHRPAGDEHHRDVDPQRRHQHARRDLVAVGDAHHRIGAVGIDHVFDAVGDQVAAGSE